MKPMLVPELLKTLESSDGERAAAKFLVRHPVLVRWSMGSHGTHAAYVLHEFPIGIGYQADFVVLTAWSGAWEVIFVELEPVKNSLVTRQGVLNKRTHGAVKQIVDWNHYVERNRASVQNDLAEWCRKKDKLGWHAKGEEPMNHSGDALRDLRTHVRFRYGIVSGRRAQITQEARSQALKYAGRMDIEIRSYDCFVDVAENLDAFTRNPDKSVYMCESKGI